MFHFLFCFLPRKASPQELWRSSRPNDYREALRFPKTKHKRPWAILLIFFIDICCVTRPRMAALKEHRCSCCRAITEAQKYFMSRLYHVHSRLTAKTQSISGPENCILLRANEKCKSTNNGEQAKLKLAGGLTRMSSSPSCPDRANLSVNSHEILFFSAVQ